MATTEQTKQPNEMGMKLTGLVMMKKVFPTEKGDRHSLVIACRGMQENVSVGVEKGVFETHEEMGMFKGNLSFSTFKGKVYFNHIAQA